MMVTDRKIAVNCSEMKNELKINFDINRIYLISTQLAAITSFLTSDKLRALLEQAP